MIYRKKNLKKRLFYKNISMFLIKPEIKKRRKLRNKEKVNIKEVKN